MKRNCIRSGRWRWSPARCRTDRRGRWSRRSQHRLLPLPPMSGCRRCRAAARVVSCRPVDGAERGVNRPACRQTAFERDWVIVADEVGTNRCPDGQRDRHLTTVTDRVVASTHRAPSYVPSARPVESKVTETVVPAGGVVPMSGPEAQPMSSGHHMPVHHHPWWCHRSHS